MTEIRHLEVRAAVGVIFGAASIVFWSISRRLDLSTEKFLSLFLWTYAVTRIAVFVLVFLVLRIQPGGDVTVYYVPEGTGILAGGTLYKDVLTPHAPLDGYILAAILWIHHSAQAIIFFAVLADIAAVWLWMRAAKSFLPQTTLFAACALLFVNPTQLMSVDVDGQFNALISLFLALAVLAVVRNREFLSGLWVGMSAATVKFLTLIFAPGFLFISRRRTFAVLGFLIALVGIYGGFAAHGINIAYPLHAEANHKTDANLIFLVELITGHDVGNRLPDVILGLCWLVVVAATFVGMRRAPDDRSSQLRVLLFSLVAELMCIQVLSKNTWDRYLVMAMFPMCTLIAEFSFTEIVLYAGWAAVYVFAPSIWSILLHFQPATALHSTLFHSALVGGFLLPCDAIVVCGNAWLLYRSVQLMLRIPRASVLSEEATLMAT